MPLSIHRTTRGIHFRAVGIVPPSYSLSSQPSVDLSSWMLKGSIPTFGLNSERIPHPKNTSIISQTLVWTLDPDGLLRHLGRIYVPNSGNLRLRVLQYSHITPCRTFRSDEDSSPSPPTLLLAWTSELCQRLLQIVYHLFPRQPVRHKLMTSQATSDSREALEFNLNGFHREAPIIIRYTSILVIVDHLSSSHSSSRLMIPLRPPLAQLFVLHVL